MRSAAGVTILDGGMGHLLRRMGVEVKGEIGSVERFLGVALANTRQPELVRAAHREYLRAGATVLTTNSYSCVPRVVGDHKRVLEHIRAAGEHARAAADEHGQGVLVAGCLPPLNASYRADLVGPDEELDREYALIAKAVAPYCDVFLCETMASAREAAAAAKAASAASAATNGQPVWVSWALEEPAAGGGQDAPSTLLSGETVEQAVAALDMRPGGPIEACLFNCSLPASISAALPRLRRLLPEGVATGAYANGFITVRSPGGGSSEYNKDLTPDAYAELCAEWARGGASVLGGCCGVFPEHIDAMAKLLSSSADMPTAAAQRSDARL